jgi:hypothetical protein
MLTHAPPHHFSPRRNESRHAPPVLAYFGLAKLQQWVLKARKAAKSIQIACRRPNRETRKGRKPLYDNDLRRSERGGGCGTRTRSRGVTEGQHLRDIKGAGTPQNGTRGTSRGSADSQTDAPGTHSPNSSLRSECVHSVHKNMPPDLRLIVDRWDDLPEKIRNRITDLIHSATSGDRPAQ